MGSGKVGKMVNVMDKAQIEKMKAGSLKDLTKNMRDDQVSGESKEKMQAMIKKMGAERLSTASIPSDLKLKNIKIDEAKSMISKLSGAEAAKAKSMFNKFFGKKS